MIEPDVATMVARWLDLVRVDLHIAERTLDERLEGAAWAVCFHAQQAAEKATKACIAATGAVPQYTHNLVALAAAVPPGLTFDVDEIGLGLLTTYAAATRYVMSDLPDDPAPGWEAAASAVLDARSIVASCTAWLAAAGHQVGVK